MSDTHTLNLYMLVHAAGIVLSCHGTHHPLWRRRLRELEGSHVSWIRLHLLVERVEFSLGEPASLAREDAHGTEGGDEDGEKHRRRGTLHPPHHSQTRHLHEGELLEHGEAYGGGKGAVLGHLRCIGDHHHGDALDELVAAHGGESEIKEQAVEDAHGNLREHGLQGDDGETDESVENQGGPARLGDVGDDLAAVGVLGGVRQGLDVGQGVHGGGADPGAAAHRGGSGDEGQPEHVDVVRGGLLQAGGVVDETGGDVLVHVQEDGARGGGGQRRQLDPVGHGPDVDQPRARRGGAQGGGQGEGVEGDAVVARQPGGEDAADSDGDGGREVTDDVADGRGAIGGALQVREHDARAEGDQSDDGGGEGEVGGNVGVEVGEDDLLGGFDAEDDGNQRGEGLVGELGEVLDQVGGGGDRDEHEDD
mmetsp:Transcript_24256/g.60237  ORF Transcript_24256/g.60237 Transcript_24256/m.60237 type:complete len:421 (-) Transcript_24256:727-1989(-)